MKRWLAVCGCVAVAGLYAGCSEDDNPAGDGIPVIPPDTVSALAMTTGSWWVELTRDTARSTTRSSDAAGVTSTTVVGERHTYYRMTGSWEDGGTTYYAFLESDTVYTESGSVDRVENDTLLLMVRNNQVLTMPENMGYLGYADSLYLVAYQLPMTVGSQWSMFDRSVDTTVHYDLSWLDTSLAGSMGKFRVQASGTGTAHVTRMMQYAMSARQLDCFEIEYSFGGPFSLTVDSALSFQFGPLPVNIPQGTELVTGDINAESTEYLGTEYTLPVRTRQVTTVYDSTALSLGIAQYWEVGRDTTWTTTRVVRAYDAATGDSLVASIQ